MLRKKIKDSASGADVEKQRSKKQAYKGFLRDQIQLRVEAEGRLKEVEVVCEQQAQFIS